MSHYEHVMIGQLHCLRVRATKVPVAWSRNDDQAWKSYCREVEAEAPKG